MREFGKEPMAPNHVVPCRGVECLRSLRAVLGAGESRESARREAGSCRFRRGRACEMPAPAVVHASALVSRYSGYGQMKRSA